MSGRGRVDLVILSSRDMTGIDRNR